MHLRPILRTALMMLAVCGTGALRAQYSGFSADLKFRYGYAPNPMDHLKNTSWGSGINFSYGLGSGKLGLELGYHYKSGDLYIEPIQTDIPTGNQPLEPSASKVGGDARRNRLDGFSARLSWQSRISEDWEWQAGLMIGGTKFRHEYHGDIASANWPGNEKSWRDFYYGTPTKGGATFSPFGGLSWKYDEDTSFEFNVLLLRYKALDYVHCAGSGNYSEEGASHVALVFPKDSLAERNRMVPELEIAYVLHF